MPAPSNLLGPAAPAGAVQVLIQDEHEHYVAFLMDRSALGDAEAAFKYLSRADWSLGEAAAYDCKQGAHVCDRNALGEIECQMQSWARGEHESGSQ